jgi:hypothetical protein
MVIMRFLDHLSRVRIHWVHFPAFHLFTFQVEMRGSDRFFKKAGCMVIKILRRVGGKEMPLPIFTAFPLDLRVSQ